jgi:hypothetical protein
MTEAEWQKAKKPKAMLELLKGRASDRKLRLFGVECHLTISENRRTVAGPPDDEQLDMEAVVRLADGADNLEEVRRGWDYPYPEWPFDWCSVILLCSSDEDRGFPTSAELVALFYEIFGNPFRPVNVDPAWLTTDVRLLAEGIYAEKAFERMPILADALQEAGCDSDDLLNHLRGGGPHVRGCWALDLVLGKE